MGKPTHEFIPSPNFRAGRRKPISAVVVHYTGDTSLDGTIGWFKRSDSKVSAHYVIGRDGRVVQMVQEEDTAWHAGRSAMDPNHKPAPTEPNVNDFSIGIELVGTPDSGFTDRQLASFYEVLAQVVTRYNVRPDRVVGHLHIAPGRKIDPDGYNAQFPWAKTHAIAQAAYRAVQARPRVPAPPASPTIT
jgi:N-acetylmuramoyl-L-alanine amidase